MTGTTSRDTSGGGSTGTVNTSGGGGGKAKPDSYSWYRVEVTNRSITDEAKREAIRAHLVWLASKLDDDTLNHQLITLKYEFMAAVDAALAADVKARAQAIQANKTEIKEEL